MTDGEIRINTSIDTSQVEEGAKTIRRRLSEIGNTRIAKGLSNIGAAVTGMGVAFSAASAAIKKISSTIKEWTGLYKTQIQSEIQLETAAKNNPYLDAYAVQQLKDYAAELQGIGTIGDEALMPLMAELAVAGRKQAEIQNIMSAALNASASGAISLEGAVKALNDSYSGQAGSLGKLVPKVKNLTEEELRQGKAVEVVAEACKGMAEETAKATGSAQQLANAWGDFKEELGAPFEKAMAPMRRFFTDLVSGWTSALQKKRQYEESKEKISSGKATTVDYEKPIEEAKKKIDDIRRAIKDFNDMEDFVLFDNKDVALASLNRELKRAQAHLRRLQEERGKLAERERKEAEDAKKAADEAERNKKAKEEESAAAEHYNAIMANRDAQIASIIKTAEVLGEEIDQQQILNAELEAYLELSQDSNIAKYKAKEIGVQKNAVIELAKSLGDLDKALEAIDETAGSLISDAEEFLDTPTDSKLSDSIAAAIDALKAQKDQFKDNADALEAYEEKIRELEELLPKVQNAELKISVETFQSDLAEINAPDVSELEALQRQKAELEARYNELSTQDLQMSDREKLALHEEYCNAMAELEKQITDAQKEENQQRIQNVADMMNQVADYISQTANIMQEASNLMLSTVKNQSDATLATLERQYKEGEIGEEEYEEKKLEAKKKAAKEEYKIRMFQWSTSILTATANIAEGVTKAIAQGGVAGIITGALVGAAGAVQIASIIASKPVQPSFATGGIVQGRSYSGDRIQANVNSGEMILNAAQQKRLWEVANGRGFQGGGMNVVINNKAANIVTAKPQFSRGEFELLIDARINEGLRSGKYDKSLAMANQGMGGEYYGI